MSKLFSILILLLCFVVLNNSFRIQKNDFKIDLNKVLSVNDVRDVNGCNCTGNECDCCQLVPGVQSSVCLDTLWDATAQTITAKATFGGFNFGQATFSEKNNQQCLNIFGGSLCIIASNLSIVSTGACGCWDVTISFFGVNADVKVGCFNFGYGATCPTSSCSSQTSCSSCDLAINCGWCSGSSQCLQGDQNGPYPPSGKCVSGWTYHQADCK